MLLKVEIHDTEAQDKPLPGTTRIFWAEDNREQLKSHYSGRIL